MQACGAIIPFQHLDVVLKPRTGLFGTQPVHQNFTNSRQHIEWDRQFPENVFKKFEQGLSLSDVQTIERQILHRNSGNEFNVSDVLKTVIFCVQLNEKISHKFHFMTLMMTSAQVVETSVNVTNNNSPSRDYSHPDDQTTQTKFHFIGLSYVQIQLLF